jgi:hypothetical protein
MVLKWHCNKWTVLIASCHKFRDYDRNQLNLTRNRSENEKLLSFKILILFWKTVLWTVVRH